MMVSIMHYNKGDIVLFAANNSKSEDNNKAVIIQADWFNVGKPPSYLICLLSPIIYHELDFRPIIKANEDNNLSNNHQAMVDKIYTLNVSQITKPIGKIGNSEIVHINGCIKAILNL